MTPRVLRARERVSQRDMAARLGISPDDLRTLEANPLDLWEVRDLAAYVSALGLKLEIRVFDSSGVNVVIA